MSPHAIIAFVAFYMMLGGLLIFHKRKNTVVGIGFSVATAIFLHKHNGHFELQELSIAILTGLLAVMATFVVTWAQRNKIERYDGLSFRSFVYGLLERTGSSWAARKRLERPQRSLYLQLMVFQSILVLAIVGITAHHFAELFPPYLEHLGEHDRFHLLWNLAAILPGFTLVSYYFEHSGAASAIARSWVGRSDTRVLWCVFLLSILLDNIAAAMIGATIVASMYGQHPPFKMIVAIVMASNLGGAPSPVGDTTTVMIFMAKVCPMTDLFKGFVAVIPVQALLTVWASWHDVKRLSERKMIEQAEHETAAADRELHAQHDPHQTMSWRSMWPMLGVVGLLIGNVAFDQPALGLWAGLGVGLAIGRIPLHGKELLKAMPNTAFLVTLVATAELLPLHEVKPFLNGMSRDELALLLGLKSAWLDNIPLTAIGISLGGFQWGFLAYCVGVGGSSMWFGSSAGVAVGQTFHEAHNTKRWFVPFFVITGLYLLGAGCHLLVWRVIFG